MDDKIKCGCDREDHDIRFKAVLQRVQDNNLQLRKSKCYVQLEEVKFHGHIFTKVGSKTGPEKVWAVVEIPKPTDQTKLVF